MLEDSAGRSDVLRLIKTTRVDIDKVLGGGIPAGSLVLLEGDSDSGKSVLCQHLAYGAVRSHIATAYYSTENSAQSLIFRMRSLNLDVTDFFLSDVF